MPSASHKAPVNATYIPNTISNIITCDDVVLYLKRRYRHHKNEDFERSTYFRKLANIAAKGGFQIPPTIVGQLQLGNTSYFVKPENSAKLKNAISIAQKIK